jgi:soluble lytic murein transglycosylase-like protein
VTVRSWSLVAAFLAAMFLGLASAAAFAAQSQPPSSLITLGQRYENGESVPKDYRRALALYCEAARNGEAAAFFEIGWMYLNGRGVPRDDASAAMWLRPAAERGVAQAANLLRLLPNGPPGSPPGCSRGSAAFAKVAPPAIRALIDETAQDVGISPELLQAVISVESGFDPHAVSPKMAAGLMQLMPETANRLAVRDPFDGRENIHAGAVHLRALLQQFDGDLTLALAAYNAGEAAVRSYGGVPPYKETRDYVAAVKQLCACDGGLSRR